MKGSKTLTRFHISFIHTKSAWPSILTTLVPIMDVQVGQISLELWLCATIFSKLPRWISSDTFLDNLLTGSKSSWSRTQVQIKPCILCMSRRRNSTSPLMKLMSPFIKFWCLRQFVIRQLRGGTLDILEDSTHPISHGLVPLSRTFSFLLRNPCHLRCSNFPQK